MARCPAADKFANNVIRRSEFDIVVRTRLIILLSFLPLLISILGVTFIRMNGEVDLAASSLVTTAAEFSILGFLLFVMSYRTYKHSMRDVDWMDALIDYVASKKANTKEMEKYRNKLRPSLRKVSIGISLILMAFNVLYLLCIGVFFYSHGDLFSEHVVMMSGLSLTILFIQFLLTSGSTVLFPGGHDQIQSKFTEAMSNSLASVGISVPTMPNHVRKRHILIHILLFIVTFGLYLVFSLFESSIKMNRHLYNQWDYEVTLLDSIMKIEGATGVEPVP